MTVAAKKKSTKKKTAKRKGGRYADLPPEERMKKRNSDYMREVYSGKRKERYAKDKNYRKEILERERKAYTERTGMEPKDYGDLAGQAGDYAVEREIYTSRKTWATEPRMVLTRPRMALFLGAAEKVFATWVRSGKFPAPEAWCVGGYHAYSIERADRLAAILNEGLKGRGSFRETDTTLIARLAKA